MLERGNKGQLQKTANSQPFNGELYLRKGLKLSNKAWKLSRRM